MKQTTLAVPPEVLEESGIDLGAILQFTAVDGKITIEQLGTRRCVNTKAFVSQQRRNGRFYYFYIFNSVFLCARR